MVVVVGPQPLFRAVMARREPIAFILIKAGANPDIPTRVNQTIWDKTDQYLSRSATQRMRSAFPSRAESRLSSSSYLLFSLTFFFFFFFPYR